MARAQNGDVEIEYEVFGDTADPLLVLISGLGTQMLFYDEEFCRGFVDRGFSVVRLDNRDIGLSTILSDDHEYTLSEMAADVIAVIDDVGAERVIVFGTSLGGMIAQTVAAEHPDRVAGLVSLSSTTGEGDVGQPSEAALEALSRAPKATAAEQIENDLEIREIWASPEWHDRERTRDYFERVYSRAFTPGSTRRQLEAIMRSGERSTALTDLAMPALVIHGDRDTLIDISGGRRTAELIPEAELMEIEGMGHDLPSQVWAQVIAAVTALAARVAG